MENYQRQFLLIAVIYFIKRSPGCPRNYRLAGRYIQQLHELHEPQALHKLHRLPSFIRDRSHESITASSVTSVT